MRCGSGSISSTGLVQQHIDCSTPSSPAVVNWTTCMQPLWFAQQRVEGLRHSSCFQSHLSCVEHGRHGDMVDSSTVPATAGLYHSHVPELSAWWLSQEGAAVSAGAASTDPRSACTVTGQHGNPRDAWWLIEALHFYALTWRSYATLKDIERVSLCLHAGKCCVPAAASSMQRRIKLIRIRAPRSNKFTAHQQHASIRLIHYADS